MIVKPLYKKVVKCVTSIQIEFMMFKDLNKEGEACESV